MIALVEAALAAGRQGRKGDARRLAREAMRRLPREPRVLEWRARAAAAAGRLAEARRLLDERAALPNPGHAALLLRAGLRLLLGDGRGGWEDLGAARRAAPSLMFSYAEARRPRRVAPAEALFSEDLLDAGRVSAALDREVRRSPRAAWARAWRGLARRRSADYAGCVEDLNVALRLGARSADALCWRGEARLQLGDRGGFEDLEAAVRLPCEAWHFAWLGRARVAFGRDRAALAAFDEAVRREPGNGWYYAWRGEAKRLLGERRGMLEDLDRALALDTGYGYQGWVRAWRGLALLSLGRPREALADFDAALERRPGYGLAVSGRSRALRALGRGAQWARELERAARLDAKLIDTLASRPPQAQREDARALARARGSAALAWRGFFLLHARDFSPARRCLERAAAQDRRSAWARAWLGLSLDCLGQPAAAVRHYTSALRLEPKAALARSWRARALLAQGRAAAALRDLERAARDDDRFADIHADLGRLRLMLGRRKQAAAALRKALSMGAGDPAWRAELERALALAEASS